MAQNLKVTGPLKLPKAPKGYDERDQDHTRRLIELALMAYSRQLQDTAAAIGVSNADQGFNYNPISPIVATVHTNGSATPSSAYIQLLNPAGSNKIVVVWAANILGIAANSLIRARFTQTPSDLTAGTVTTATAMRMDETDATSIVATLKGTTQITGNTPFTSTQAIYNQNQLVETAGGPHGNAVIGRGPIFGNSMWGALGMYRPNYQPVVLQPGDAFEFVANVTNTALRMQFLWDELPLTAVVGTDLGVATAALSGVHSSIWGTMTQQIGSVSVGAMIQFLNPGPKIAKITTLNVQANNSSYARLFRTGVPSVLGPGGTLNTGVRMRMARRDALGVQCQIYGMNINTNFGGDRLFWRDKGRSGASGDVPFDQVVGPHSFPLYIMPGEALEFANESTGNIPISMQVFWDEIDLASL